MVYVYRARAQRIFSPTTLRFLWVVADMYEERNRAMILLMLAFKKGSPRVCEKGGVKSSFIVGQHSVFKRRAVRTRKLPLRYLYRALGEAIPDQHGEDGELVLGLTGTRPGRGVEVFPPVVPFLPRVPVH